jgi:hypothetical protein
MAEGAAHLVDHVLPHVPYRQWVFGYPFELGGMLAFQPDLLLAVERLVTDALCRWQADRGNGKPGGIFVRHRFGSGLNLTLHGHVLLVDGVYRTSESGELQFVPTQAPTQAELQSLAENIHRRLLTLLRRRGLLREDTHENNEQLELDALLSCNRAARSVGKRERSGPALSAVDEEDMEQPRGGLSARLHGLHVYTSTPITDRESLEKLCRYLLRGPLAQERLKQRPDGTLTYRLKKADRRGNTVLVLSPTELLMRLSSLIPAPGHPTRKYFGVLAGGAKERSAVVPTPPPRNCHSDSAEKPIAIPPRIPWALLLSRIWGIDALQCPKCSAVMTPIAIIKDKDEAARFLAHFGELPQAVARGPPQVAA